VYYHKENKECDFVVKSGLKITAAIQVCESLNIENYTREFEGLTEAIDSYGLEKGLLICNHNELKENLVPDTIQVISATDWLLTN
jgi:predicted AAA+ superfamily ATPase